MKYRVALLSFIFVAISLGRAAPISHEEIAKNSSNGLHLLQFTEDGEPIWKTEEEEFELKRKGVNFVINQYLHHCDLLTFVLVRRDRDLRSGAAVKDGEDD